MSFSQLIAPLFPQILLATGVWLLSLWRKDVSLIDSFWSLFFVVAIGTWGSMTPALPPRALMVGGLVLVWAVRLSLYLTVRNWGQPEDRRYLAIRERNQPYYPLKSLFIVFFLQVFLAWCVSWPLLPSITSAVPIGLLDGVGVIVFLAGFAIESLADWQMRAFKKGAYGARPVMDQGLWGACRHPNYLGESLVWWGFFLIAIGAGAPLWLLVSPAFMTFLLLRVSGVPLLETDLSNRHPAYRRYMEETPAFLPRWRRS